VLQAAAFRRFSFEAAHARVAEECRRHVDAPHPWGSFRVQNRTARSVALLPFGMLARSARVMTPYLDRDLGAFLAALPTRTSGTRTERGRGIPEGPTTDGSRGIWRARRCG